FIDEITVQFASSKQWIPLAPGVFVLANGWHISRLLVLERGHYKDAIEMMERQTLGTRMEGVMEHTFRQGLMFDYYARRLDLTKNIEVLAPSANTMHSAEWLVVHKLEANFNPTPLIDSEGVRFELIKHYPFPGLSGWHLCIYRRTATSVTVP